MDFSGVFTIKMSCHVRWGEGRTRTVHLDAERDGYMGWGGTMLRTIRTLHIETSGQSVRMSSLFLIKKLCLLSIYKFVHCCK